MRREQDHLQVLKKMLSIIFAIGLVLFILYLLVKPYFSPLRHLPEPKGWPILGHTPFYLMNEDHVALQSNWCNQFYDVGLYKTRSLLRKFRLISFLFIIIFFFYFFACVSSVVDSVQTLPTNSQPNNEV